MNNTKTQEIPIKLLIEHPENSNFMDTTTAQKLRRHIEQTGRYEPLTVRLHPIEEGKFQVVNGHNRLRVLRALNYQTVCCVVWNLDDDQTRLYLATLNRLSGKDVPERRAVLMDNLLHSFDLDELSALLPDNRKQIQQLERLSHLEMDELSGQQAIEQELEVPIILSFFLDEQGAKELNLALDLAINSDKSNPTRGQALVRLAQFYLSLTLSTRRNVK